MLKKEGSSELIPISKKTSMEFSHSLDFSGRFHIIFPSDSHESKGFPLVFPRVFPQIGWPIREVMVVVNSSCYSLVGDMFTA